MVLCTLIDLFFPSLKVWQLSDARKEGRLDKDGFIVALCLISLAQQGKRPLSLDALRSYGTQQSHSYISVFFLPVYLLSFLTVPSPPKLTDIPPMKAESPQFEWVVTPQERKQYLELFRTSDDDGDGFITGTQARTLFSGSGLQLSQLGAIWYVRTPFLPLPSHLPHFFSPIVPLAHLLIRTLFPEHLQFKPLVYSSFSQSCLTHIITILQGISRYEQRSKARCT